MGTGTLAQAPVLPLAIRGWPRLPLTKALQGAGGFEDTLLTQEHQCSSVSAGH